MTLLIPDASAARYRAATAMEGRPTAVSVLRRLLERPGDGREAEEALAVAAACLPPEAAEQVARFAERVRELSGEERQELFDETFADESRDCHERSVALLRRLEDRGEVRAELAPLLERLDLALARHRNPYHHLVVALRALLAAPHGS